ncbi:MAG: TolC family protein [Lentisphaeria bacterium]|nr:TolC family protein [Lentisphaeria bacterium]
MEIKLFIKCTVIFTVLFLASGCVSTPQIPETLESFRRAFSEDGKVPELQSGNILTLDSAVRTTLANNPDIRSAIRSVYAAKYGYYQALSAYLPEINARYSIAPTLSRGWDLKNPPEGLLRKNDHLITSGTIEATFLLFDGFARELESIIADLEYKRSIEVAKNVKRLLIRAVSFAYYDMYLAGEEIKIFTEDLAFQSDALLQEEQRFRSGHVSKASVLNFRILAARAQSNISDAEYRKKVALHALVSLMGCDSGKISDELKLQKISVDELPDIYDDDFYLELAVSNRPDLEAEKIIFETAFRSRQKVYAEFLPVIHLFSELSLYTYHARYSHNKFNSAHGNQRGFTYGAEGSWNLFQGFNTYNKLRRQLALEKAARWGLNKKFLEILSEVRDACSNCKNARCQVGIYQSMSDWVREQRNLVYSEYRNGRETITRLNEAQSALIEAQSRLVISAIQLKKSAIQLAAVTGTEYFK